MSPTPEARARRDHRVRLAVSGIAVWLIAITVAGGFYLFSIDHSKDELVRAHNPLVCTFRKYLLQSLARAEQAAGDKATSQSSRQRAAAAIASTSDILANLITIPRDYQCPEKKP